ncbi:MAG: PASTA domain-containing protein [Ruminococcaceae bacterium]|nr:PASTA domain-containing protein [Oscillospiraceae bacterium]
MEKERLCLRCMRKIGESEACPYCKDESREPQQAPYLPLKTVVGGKYLVGKRVSTNGDGSTYYGFDLDKKQAVMIRECFPEGEVTRGDDNYCLVNVGRAAAFIDAKAKFTKLWNTLKNITGCSAIVPVLDVFEDLGTAYAISEYLGEGETLRDYLLKNEQGYILWEEARVLLMPVLSALGVLHENGIIHGAISPNSLIVDKDGKVKITDYSIDDVRTKGGKLPLELSDGYAAIEQYAEDGELGPWTDVYGFATVLYRVLVGSTPMNSVSRATNDKLMIPGKFAEIIPAYVINALVNALQILPEDRTENVEFLRDDLSASPTAAVSAAEAYSSFAQERRTEREAEISDEHIDEYEETEDYIPQKSGIKRSTLITFIVSVVVCLAILLAVVFVIKGNNSEGEETSTTEETQTGEVTDTTGDDFINVTLPDFRGMDIEEIKANETYKQVLIISTVYEDSDKEKGTVIAQDLPEGTVVSSINKRSITLKISDGLLVPDLVGEDATKVLKTLTDKGFKYVETVVSSVAGSEEQSNKVSSIVYYPEENANWEDLPHDRRISATQKVVIYCYGEYTPPTTEEPTTEKPTTEEPTTEKITENEDVIVDNGNNDSEDVIIE